MPPHVARLTNGWILALARARLATRAHGRAPYDARVQTPRPTAAAICARTRPTGGSWRLSAPTRRRLVDCVCGSPRSHGPPVGRGSVGPRRQTPRRRAGSAKKLSSFIDGVVNKTNLQAAHVRQSAVYACLAPLHHTTTHLKFSIVCIFADRPVHKCRPRRKKNQYKKASPTTKPVRALNQ